MFIRLCKPYFALCWFLASAYISASPCFSERIDNGDQVIDGTQVHTTIYHERGYAIFSNDCGSQQLTQRQLQAGARPTDIIPCPRPRSATQEPEQTRESPNSIQTGARRWAAVAAGIDNGFLGLSSKVGAGIGRDFGSRAAAEAAALSKCRETVSSCSVVSAWNSGCYYITVSDHGDNVAWGSGRTAQEAYDECYKRVRGGNCKTSTLGACYP